MFLVKPVVSHLCSEFLYVHTSAESLCLSQQNYSSFFESYELELMSSDSYVNIFFHKIKLKTKNFIYVSTLFFYSIYYSYIYTSQKSSVKHVQTG